MLNNASPAILTIGHSNHEMADLLALLIRHQAQMLVDVRSWPGSRYLPQFNRAPLEAALEAAAINYMWFGKALGGKADDPALLTGDGKPDYTKMAARRAFQDALAELIRLAQANTVAIMCAEGDPARCHRTNLVGHQLLKRGVAVTHILRDGTLLADGDLPSRKPPAQPDLFG
ncbi:MAG: DUF488 domain-containing protein [Alphaproteobacteria bacterium]|jgi:uncharacterized protein (DUF488 family)|nr:DUF488 domain-containing protein [Alphaproteobacteria bacterium]